MSPPEVNSAMISLEEIRRRMNAGWLANQRDLDWHLEPDELEP